MNCSICGNNLGLFSKKILDGHICKECKNFIPLDMDITSSAAWFLQKIIDENKEKQKVFTSTASYGNMYLDSVHGMFCFSSLNKDGEPLLFGDIYKITELTEFGIYMTDVKNIGTKTNKIVCNIKSRVTTKNSSKEYLVIQNESCDFVKDGNSLDVKEPGKLSIFRNMFYQMVEDVEFNLKNKLKDIQILNDMTSVTEIKKEWAKGILFLEDDCSKEKIKKKQKELLNIFHPDNNKDIGVDYSQKINEAVEILSKTQ